MKIKTDAKKHVRFDRSGNGCGLGCCSIGCMGIVGMLLLFAVVGYYTLFYTVLPLQLIEAAIKEDGKVDIVGLTGNLANGFAAEELRFKTMDDQWSNLTDIQFKYESDSSFFGTESLIIKEVSVGGGTIYADWDPEENEIEFDPIDNELDDFREEFGHSAGLREFRIDLMSVANLKIVNPTTKLEITIDEMKFEGFNWQKGNLQDLGHLTMQSSQMDLETLPSVDFAGEKNARRFEGTIRTQADHRLTADVPFIFDFAVNDELKVSVNSELFDGQVRLYEDNDQCEVVYQDFSPADFIELASGAVLPSNIDMKLELGNNRDRGPTQVNHDGSFQLGQTRFTDFRIEQVEGGPSIVIASGQVDGHEVSATMKNSDPFSLQWEVKLSSEDFASQESLWAHTLFGSDYSELDGEQQNAVIRSMSKPANVEKNDEEPLETDTTIPAEANIENTETTTTSVSDQ